MNRYRITEHLPTQPRKVGEATADSSRDAVTRTYPDATIRSYSHAPTGTWWMITSREGDYLQILVEPLGEEGHHPMTTDTTRPTMYPGDAKDAEQSRPAPTPTPTPPAPSPDYIPPCTPTA